MPPRISERVRELHKALIEADCAGKIVLKKDVEKLMMERWEISFHTTKFYIDTGKELGLWDPVGDARNKSQNLVLSSGPPGLLIARG